MKVFEKIQDKTKKGLAIIVAGAIIGIGGISYAKEINDNGWPLPDESQYLKMGEDTEKFSCKYKDKDIVVEAKVESYASFNGQGYKKYSFENKTFMYAKIGPGEGHSFKVEVLMDRDGNGSLETKYDLNKETDEEEFDNEGIPEWVLEKSVQS